MNVAIYSQKVNRHNLPYFKEIISIFNDFGWNPVFEKELKEQLVAKMDLSEKTDEFSSHKDFHSGIDLTMSIGGDGTFIKSVGFIRDSGVPILGINTGRLGFLANISKDQIQQTMDQVKAKNYEFQKRSLLRIQTEENIFGEDNFALNELTVQKKDTASMITVHAYLDNKYLNSYWADGLIVSTPTGSTAYSLSCGGPIITPGCQVHILTPIAPHNLNVRPVVVPDRKCLISLDGVSKNIRQDEEIIVTKAEFMINVVKFESNNFLDTIRNKMMWGIDARN
jgi:NAD+ kinase